MEKSKLIAKTLIDKYCDITGYKNRGAKPDTSTRHGRLGWIRDTKPWATLIECCFIDNKDDMKKFEVDMVAYAIYEGVCDIFNVPPVKESKEEIKRKIFELINKL